MKKTFVVFMLVCAVFTAQFFGIGLNLPVVYAGDLTGTDATDDPTIYNFITDFHLTETGTGNTLPDPLGPDVPQDGEFRITYDFEIPQRTASQTGLRDEDSFILDLPQYVEVPVDVNNVEIIDGNTDLHIFTVHMRQGIGTGGVDGILVEFTEELENNTINYEFMGAFWFEANFADDEIDGGGSYTIDFDSGREAAPYQRIVDFDWDPAEFTKSNNSATATYNTTENRHYITWTLDINVNDVHMGSSVEVTDVIDTTWMEYLDNPGHPTNSGNVTQTVGSANFTADYDSASNTLTINFIDDPDTNQVFTYQTAVLPNAYIDNLTSSNSTLSMSNNARLVVPDEGDDITSNTSVASFPLDVIDKGLDDSIATGYSPNGIDYANNAMYWIITANPNGYEAADAYVIDDLDSELTMDETTIRFEYMESGTVYTTFPNTPANDDIDYSVNGDQYRFDLGDINEPVQITFVTEFEDIYHTQENEEYTNTAHFYPPAITSSNNAATHVVPLPSEVITKTYEGRDQTDVEPAYMNWQIEINPFGDSRGVIIEDLYVWDNLPDALVLHDPNGDGDYSDAFTVTNTLDSDNNDAINDEIAGATITYDSVNRQIVINFDPDNTRNDAGAVARDEIDETYYVTYRTDIRTGYEYIYKQNDNTSITNTAQFESYNAGTAASSASGNINPQVITKSFVNYDHDKHIIYWEVEINESMNDLYNPLFTDYIPEDMEYVEDSFVLLDSSRAELDKTITGGYSHHESHAAGTVTHTTPGTSEVQNVSGTLTYSFFPRAGESGYLSTNFITDTYYIQFATTFVDGEVLERNEHVDTNNTGYLEHDQDNGRNIYFTGPTDFNSSIIAKDDDYGDGNQYIDWIVTINRNQITLTGPNPDPYPDNTHEGPILYDELQEGLTLDKDSIVLYEASVNADGTVNIDPDGDGNDNVITIDTSDGDNTQVHVDENNVMAFEFAEDIVASDNPGTYECYQMTFRTIIDSGYSGTVFDNTASFYALSGNPEITSGGSTARYAVGNGYAASNVGHLELKKVDEQGNNLAGATFRLFDSNGGFVKDEVSDANGVVLFECIFFNRDYYVREIEAPNYYEGDNTLYGPYRINSDDITSADDPDRKITVSEPIVNTPNPVSVQFTKYASDTGLGLQGALFSIYLQGFPGAIIAQAESDVNGIVTFTNLQANRTYEIIEASPPLGYLPDTANPVLTVVCTVGDVPFVPTPDRMTNTPDGTATSSVLFTKYGPNPSTPLEGCVFGLYRTSLPSFLLATAASQADGVVEFENIPAGSYVIREISAPAGYAISSTELTVTVGPSTGNYYTSPDTLVNYPAKSGNPRTGDSQSSTKYIIILAIAFVNLLLAGGYLLIKRLKTKKV